MATFQAITAVSNAVLELLNANYDPANFNNLELEFRVYLSGDFKDPTMTRGVSLFVYRVFPNGTHRRPGGRIINGRRYRTQLPVDIHFLLTAWAEDATLQLTIIGWMMRTMEDTPIISSALLNTFSPEIFQSDETVEISLADLSTEDLVRMWDTMVQDKYQLSVPYVARNVRIESEQPLTAVEPVRIREFNLSDQPEPQ